MGLLDDMADELARLALEDEKATNDDKIVAEIGEILGSSSQTLQEAFLTAVRVRRAELRARTLLAKRAFARKKAASAGQPQPARKAPPSPAAAQKPAPKSGA